MELTKVEIDQFEQACIQERMAEPFMKTVVKHLLFTLSKDNYAATHRDYFLSTAYAVRDHLVARWTKTQQEYYHRDVKRVYYLSMEFLMGRALGNNLINLGIYDQCAASLQAAGLDLDELQDAEVDAGLGNGGLGRLAACFLDSMATLQLPAYGYGIRYEYGIFYQRLRDGFQVETPDNWLRYTNPWEIARPEFLYPVHFFGEVQQHVHRDGEIHYKWVNTDNVMAMAYDTPVAGYGTNTVNTLRLWSSKSSRDFNLEFFNRGDYRQAVDDKTGSDTISKILYPEDSTRQGKELRLKQEYFFVCATLQDILRRYDKSYETIDELPAKVAIQLNDTHPALGIAELMRILVDERHISWEKAWDLTTNVFAYTNHTVLPEALEKWKVSFFEQLLPRHLQIIYEINRRFLDTVWIHHPGDHDRVRRMSLIEEGPEKQVRMANLCIVGSHSVNGVSALHSEILKQRLFKDFYELMPGKFNNKTNGITQRRWLVLANRRLTALLTEYIGAGFVTDLYQLEKLVPLAGDPEFQAKWRAVKHQNKVDFMHYVKRELKELINPDSLFDVQVKRIHEYKRQLLNVLHVIHLFLQLHQQQTKEIVPRTVFFAGKAAPGYAMAKLIIKLITSVAHLVNNDPVTRGKLKVVFLPNYSVSLGQKIFPAADLSEQISTAGTEASGTGNMKFALNGALTIGTLDGANVEILEEVGAENFFLFGLKTPEVEQFRAGGYNPYHYYQASPDLKQVLDLIAQGMFSPENPDLFHPITDGLLAQGDYYCLCADFDAYLQAQQRVAEAYRDQARWTKMSILNVAQTGKFSSDRTIQQYAAEIWQAQPVKIDIE